MNLVFNRQGITPTEAVAIGRLIEEEHRTKIQATLSDKNRRIAIAREAKRRGDTKMLNEHSGVRLGTAQAAAASKVGMSPSGYHRAKAVVAAAESDPEKFVDQR